MKIKLGTTVCSWGVPCDNPGSWLWQNYTSTIILREYSDIPFDCIAVDYRVRRSGLVQAFIE